MSCGSVVPMTSPTGWAFAWSSRRLHMEQCLKPVDVDVREGRTFPVIE
jgi:hypothetical protein